MEGSLVYLSPEIPLSALVYRNKVEIRQWSRTHTLISKDEDKAWREALYKDSSKKLFGILCKQSDKELGVCGFTNIDRQNQSAEFSIYIYPKEQKKGVGKDALVTLLRHGFEDWNFHRIWGESFVGNPALTLFQKVGFKAEGLKRGAYFKKGKFIDSVVISILRPELPA